MTGLADRVNLFGDIRAIVETICEISGKKHEKGFPQITLIAAEKVKRNQLENLQDQRERTAGKKCEKGFPQIALIYQQMTRNSKASEYHPKQETYHYNDRRWKSCKE